ncbi:MAG: globin-coupled sensor protein [Erythrobacter sp.]|uniref:globin-coupled sensor protein n=1 Tax=Erythrobacter sp. TaxID=1042 RepID=UPI0026101C85|nr:globin-coupled sensor protein [Erythrobacter sp.]MDJ0977111.1 globin-coupled sensor protein [Erythrobacter sp.]
MAHRPLSERLEYYGIKARDPAYKGVSRAVRKRIDTALDVFYAELASRENLAAKFENPEMMRRARNAQSNHWISVFEQGVDDRFRDRAAHIGAVHARIGLEPKWYVGSYARLLEHLIEEIVAPGWKRFLPWKRAEARRVVALIKVSLLDIEVALSSYFFDLKGKVSSVNEGLGSALSSLASGELAIEPVKLPNEYEQVEKDFNTTIETLQETIGAVVQNVRTIRTGSAEIRSASDDLARRTEEQAANLEETAAAIAETNQRIQDTAATTNSASGTIAAATQIADDGSSIVAQAVSAMDQIEKSSEEINNIISVIDSIAFQTNLLALNAGVEAARAGETGKGFAVVASEVRALAQRCAEAADDVKGLISASSEHVSSGVDLVKRSGESFDAITKGVTELQTSIRAIAESTEIQATSISQITTTVRDLDNSTQQNAAMAEQCTAAAASLASEAERLGESVGHFSLASHDQYDAHQLLAPSIAA